MGKIILNTVGTTVIQDLGEIELKHPINNLTLYDSSSNENELELEEIKHSSDLQNALTEGLIYLVDEKGLEIKDLFSYVSNEEVNVSFYYNSFLLDRALVNNQINVYEEYGEGLSFTCPKTDNYRLNAFWYWSTNNNKHSMSFRVLVYENNNPAKVLFQSKIESREIGGSGVIADVIKSKKVIGKVNTGTDTKIPQIAFGDFTLKKGVNYKWILEFSSEAKNSRLCVHSAQISIEQKSIKKA